MNYVTLLCTRQILGYSLHNDRIVTRVVSSNDTGKVVVATLKSGHPSEKKIDSNAIIDHINLFHPPISHYWREHAPLSKYMPSDININLMHSDLKKYSNVKVSYELCRKQAAQMNTSFTSIGHEERWQCETFNVHEQDAIHSKANISPDCNLRKKLKIPKRRTALVREENQKDVLLN